MICLLICEEASKSFTRYFLYIILYNLFINQAKNHRSSTNHFHKWKFAWLYSANAWPEVKYFLLNIIKIFLSRYVNSCELIIQIKSNEFFQESLLVCFEFLEKGHSGLFEIIRKIYNSKNSFYVLYPYKSFSSYYENDFKDIILVRFFI